MDEPSDQPIASTRVDSESDRQGDKNNIEVRFIGAGSLSARLYESVTLQAALMC